MNEQSLGCANFPSAWKLAASRNRSIPSVAVIDTGVARHKDLPTPNALEGFGADAMDEHGHGTWVVGILCAAMRVDIGIGMAGAMQCNLSVYRVVHRDGWNAPAYYRALRRVTSEGVQVINLSLGGDERDPTEEFLLSIYREGGGIVVAAAGNHKKHGNPPIFPGALDGVLAVSGVHLNGEPTSESSSGAYVFIAAPAQACTTGIHNDYRNVHGTSFAAPSVTAAIALALSVRPQINAQTIRELLQTTARGRPENGRDDELGYGILDAGALMEEVLSLQ